MEHPKAKHQPVLEKMPRLADTGNYYPSFWALCLNRPSNYFSTYSLPTFFFSQLKQIVKLKIPRTLFSRSLYWYLLLLCPSRDKDYHLRTYKSVVMANKLIDWLIAQVSSFAASQMLFNKNTSCWIFLFCLCKEFDEVRLLFWTPFFFPFKFRYFHIVSCVFFKKTPFH